MTQNLMCFKLYYVLINKDRIGEWNRCAQNCFW